MSEKEKINSEGLKNVSGGSNVGLPNPYPFKCPKCGKRFDMTEFRVGCGEYCKECQEKYPEELPINDPKSPLGRLVNNRKLNESQEKDVIGGSDEKYPDGGIRTKTKPMPRPVFNPNVICPKCGKSFNIFEVNILGSGGYCEECQKKYPDELPRKKHPEQFRNCLGEND